MTTAIHRAARHALPDDPLRDAKVAQAVEAMDMAAKAGKHDATALQATREAKEAGLWKA